MDHAQSDGVPQGRRPGPRKFSFVGGRALRASSQFDELPVQP